MGDAFVPRRLQQADVAGGQRVRPAGPAPRRRTARSGQSRSSVAAICRAETQDRLASTGGLRTCVWSRKSAMSPMISAASALREHRVEIGRHRQRLGLAAEARAPTSPSTAPPRFASWCPWRSTGCPSVDARIDRHRRDRTARGHRGPRHERVRDGPRRYSIDGINPTSMPCACSSVAHSEGMS